MLAVSLVRKEGITPLASSSVPVFRKTVRKIEAASIPAAMAILCFLRTNIYQCEAVITQLAT